MSIQQKNSKRTRHVCSGDQDESDSSKDLEESAPKRNSEFKNTNSSSRTLNELKSLIKAPAKLDKSFIIHIHPTRYKDNAQITHKNLLDISNSLGALLRIVIGRRFENSGYPYLDNYHYKIYLVLFEEKMSIDILRYIIHLWNKFAFSFLIYLFYLFKRTFNAGLETFEPIEPLMDRPSLPLVAISRVNNVNHAILLCGQDDEFCYSENIETQELGMMQNSFKWIREQALITDDFKSIRLDAFLLRHHKKRRILQNMFIDYIKNNK